MMLNISSNSSARYVVGFDLGTTNSAVCYVDTQETPWQVRTFAVPQLVAAGQVESRETLPSFHYQARRGRDDGEAEMPGERRKGEGERKKSDQIRLSPSPLPFLTSSASSPASKARSRRAG